MDEKKRAQYIRTLAGARRQIAELIEHIDRETVITDLANGSDKTGRELVVLRGQLQGSRWLSPRTEYPPGTLRGIRGTQLGEVVNAARQANQHHKREVVPKRLLPSADVIGAAVRLQALEGDWP